MEFNIYDLFSFSIAIAAVIAVARFKRIYPGFRPFLFVCWAALTTEVACFILIRNKNYTFLPFGIYSLAESLLIAWLFRQLDVFEKKPYLFTLLMVLYPLAWTVEAVFFESLSRNMTWFRLGHSFLTVVLSVILLSKELSTERIFLLKSPVFLICTGFLLYYSCAVIAGVFELYGGSREFRMGIQMISIYVNVFVNLIYAVAVLCMPRHRRFSLPY